MIFNVQPQAEGFYCVWADDADGTIVGVEYKLRSESTWSLHRPKSTGRTFLAAPTPGLEYLLRLWREATDGIQERTIEIACRTRLSERRSWLSLVDRVPYSAILLFNSQSRFSRQACGLFRRRTVAQLDGTSVDHRDPEIPNGFYRIGDKLALLSRAIGNCLEEYPTNPPACVRAVARRLLWSKAIAPRTVTSFDPPLSSAVRDRYRVSGFVVECAPGINSRITYLRPRGHCKAGTAIYHEGHTGAAIQIGWETVAWLLERNWEVYCVDMPLSGLNSVDSRPGLAAHNDLIFFEQLWPQHPISIMVSAIRWLADRASQEMPGGSLVAIGRSGGGFLAYLSAALDSRISSAVAVAGGVPLSQRFEFDRRDLGDYEQFAPSCFDLLRHEDLMVTASIRGLLMIFNRNDPECFALKHSDRLTTYLAGEAARFDGDLRVFVDPQHRHHSLGPAGYAELERFLGRHTVEAKQHDAAIGAGP